MKYNCKMSVALLLEKYDVSTEEGLQKALNEIEKEEAEVEEALSGALSKACAVEGRLRTASQAYTKLGEVKSDALAASNMVERTASLARDVSAKVRQLDLARSRVAECQRRVHDLIDLQLCSAGVEAAIKAHDYELGASHVARFMSMDPGSVAAARARGESDPRAAMMRAADTLRDQLVLKFEEAARKEDEAAIDRFFKLFPQLGCAEEGIDLLAKYLAKQLELSLRRISTVESGSAGAVFADALTRVLEAGGAAVERVRSAGDSGRLARAVKIIQPMVCAGARRVCSSLKARAMAASGGDARRSAGDVLSVEPTLAELALSHSRLELYFAFLRRKAEVDAAGLDEAARVAAVDAMEKIISECDLTRTAQDLLAQYLALERYFLEESVNKALKLSQTADSSSLVDDVFFVARKVIRRAVSTGSVEGLCAVLNEVGSVLERGVADSLRRTLRTAPPAALPLPPPAPPAAASLLAARLTRDLDAQRQLFLAHMNEAEAGAEWVERLAGEACAAAESLVRTASERAKLQSCAGGLGSAAAGFRAAHELAAAALAATLRAPLLAWAAQLVAPDPDTDDMTDDADALPQALDVLAGAARGELSQQAADTLLAATVSDIAARADKLILQNTYTREQALVVERRVRRLAAWSGEHAQAARERCARLTQVAAVLALERPQHAAEALLPTARVPPAHVADILARRVDFKIEDIKRLKL